MNERVKQYIERLEKKMAELNIYVEYESGVRLGLRLAIATATEHGLPNIIEAEPWHTVGGENGEEMDLPNDGEEVNVINKHGVLMNMRKDSYHNNDDILLHTWENTKGAIAVIGHVTHADQWQRIVLPKN